MAIQMTRAEYEAKYGTKPVVQPITKAPVKMTRAQYEATYGKPAPVSAVAPVPVEKTFGQKVSGGIQKIFPGQKVGQAIGTLAGYALTPKENRKYYDTSAPSVGQVIGDVAQGALTVGTAGGVRTGLQGVSKVGKLAGVGSNALNKVTIETANTVGKRALQNTAIGAGFGLTSGIKEKQSVGDTLKSTAMGAAFGLGTGLAIDGAIGAVKALPRNKPVDDNIRSIFKNTTGDIQKIDDMAFKAKKGLELLNKESPTIKIPDSKAPLGSNILKPFDIKKSKPNEFLSAVLEMDKKIVSNARKATENAVAKGITIETDEAQRIIQKAIDSGDIAKATGERMLKQIKSIENNPVKAHDWVQDVNVKYKRKYEGGTIEDTVTGKLADDVAESLRKNLDTIVFLCYKVLNFFRKTVYSYL